MAQFTQLPGDLSLKFIPGDEIQLNCDFDVDISGYTVTNQVYVTQVYATGGGNGFVSTIGATVTSFDQSVTNAGSGQMLLTLPENKSSLLTPGVGYRWYLRWVDPAGVTRTVLSGDLTVQNP